MAGLGADPQLSSPQYPTMGARGMLGVSWAGDTLGALGRQW